jgi:hypothetical protein
VGCRVTCIKLPLIANEFKASGDKNLERVFRSIVQQNKPCVVIIDELQTLLKKHKNSRDSDFSMITSLWSLLDVFENSQILFIGTLNYVEKIPEQIMDRFSDEIIEFQSPNINKREEIISFYLNQYQHIRFEKNLAKKLAKITRGFSKRGLAKVMKRAVSNAISSEDNYSIVVNPLVTLEDCINAIDYIKKSKQTNKRTLASKLKRYALKTAPHAIPVIVSCAQMYLQYKLHEKQSELQNNSLGIQKEGLEVQKDSTKMQKEGLDYQKKSFDIQRECAGYQKESLALQRKSTGYQKEGLDIQRQWFDYTKETTKESLHHQRLSFLCQAGSFLLQNQTAEQQKNLQEKAINQTKEIANQQMSVPQIAKQAVIQSGIGAAVSLATGNPGPVMTAVFNSVTGLYK